MIAVNMHEAKTQLSKLVASALNGEEVVLCSHGSPKARIVPIAPGPTARNLKPDPLLAPRLAPGYDPAEPLSEDEFPSELT